MNLNKLSEKDYENASLFSDFVKEVNMGSIPQGIQTPFRGPDISRFKRRFSIGSVEFENSMNRSNSEFWTQNSYEQSNRSPTFDQCYCEYCDSNEHSHKQHRQRVHSYHESYERMYPGRVSFGSYEKSIPGFVCYYCDAKYVYKQCLINHLNKAHRKLINYCK